jgi:gamma-glutamyl phosphate reductase
MLLAIFEARSEVIVNTTALALKSGTCTVQPVLIIRPPTLHTLDMQNLTDACTGYAAILKGGKESAHTTAELARTIQLLLRACAPGGVHTDCRDPRRSHRAALSGPVHRPSHPAREKHASARDPAQ